MRASAVVVCLLACNGNHHTASDLTGDASVDGTVDTDPATFVSVHVISPFTGDPDAEAIAMFADETGAYVQVGLVDAHGDATASLPNGGTVTTLQITIDRAIPTDPRYYDDLITFRGVKPGDHLVAAPAIVATPTASDTMTASYTPVLGDNGSPGGVTSCGTAAFSSSPPTATLTFYSSCVAASFDLMAVTNDLPQRQFLWQPDLTHVAGGTVTLADAWQPAGHLAVTVNNVPANRQRTGVTYGVVVGATSFQLDLQSVEAPAAGTHVFDVNATPGAGRMISVQTGAGGNQFVPNDRFVVVADPSTTAMTIDLATMPLPVAGPPMMTETGTVWTETNSGLGDVRLVSWNATWIAEHFHQVNWTFVEDPRDGATSSMLPRLPDAYEVDDPTRQPSLMLPDIFSQDGAVQYYDYDNLDGYDAARPYGPRLADPPSMFLDVPHTSHQFFE